MRPFRRSPIRLVAELLGFLDLAVAGAVLVVGGAVALSLALGGSSIVELLLVGLLFTGATLLWLVMSSGLDDLRELCDRLALRKPGGRSKG